MKKTVFDVAVIGMGPAGLAAAVSAAELGASVVVLDPKAESGTQKQRPCILNAVNPRELSRMGLDDSPERFCATHLLTAQIGQTVICLKRCATTRQACFCGCFRWE